MLAQVDGDSARCIDDAPLQELELEAIDWSWVLVAYSSIVRPEVARLHLIARRGFKAQDGTRPRRFHCG